MKKAVVRKVSPCIVQFLHLGLLTCVVFGSSAFAQQETITPATAISAHNELNEQIAEAKPGTAATLSRFRLGKLTGSLANLLEEHVPVLFSGAEPQIATPAFLRKLQTDIASILSTEAYFSPQIAFERSQNSESIVIQVDAGARTFIKELSINLTGALADAANAGQPEAVKRRDTLMREWGLPQGAPFSQSAWSESKTLLIENLRSDRYAGATLVDSRVSVDPDSHTANIDLDIDSGAAFTLGEIQITGLERYPLWLIDRFHPPKKGEAYSSKRLNEFQRALQNSAYFSTVAFNVEPDSTKADALPVEIALSERKTRDLGFGAGYSSNTGFRAETTYRDRNVLNQVWDMRSALRVEQKQQLSYADFYLPPSEQNRLDSFGVLFDRSHIEGLLQTRSAVGVKRTTTDLDLEHRLGMNYSQEKSVADLGAGIFTERRSHALVASAGWTWRAVDDVFEPRRGYRMQIDTQLSNKAIISDQSFFSVYGKYQYWIPLVKGDQIILRAELGKVFSGDAEKIPDSYLFRTGGSTSVRGYAYQSLGVKTGEAVLGGRLTGAISAEYVHWNTPILGVATFIDSGDAAKNWHDFSAKQGIGVGARIKTPAGPIALDVAYGKQVRKLRLDFSIAIAF